MTRKRIECRTPGFGVCPIWKAQEAEIARLREELKQLAEALERIQDIAIETISVGT